MRLYLDTSVLGAEFDTEIPYRVATTLTLFQLLASGRARTCISGVTLEKVTRAPAPIRLGIEQRLATFDVELLGESEETQALAAAYVADGAVPRANMADARHLAVATMHAVDAVVSWNFRHMVNLLRRRRVHAVSLRLGLALIGIVSPEEAIAAMEEEHGQ